MNTDEFLSNNVNGFDGDIIICDSYVVRLYSDLVSEAGEAKQIFQYAPETTHIDQFGFKLSTVLRLGRVRSVTILTKDGSPHSLQIPLIAQESAENVGFPMASMKFMVVEKGLLISVSAAAVRSARHLSEVEGMLEHQPAHTRLPQVISLDHADEPAVAILVGGRCDLESLRKSRLVTTLQAMGIKFTISVISSEQNPEELRRHCRDVLANTVSVCVCIAGLVPGLPAAVKSHLPSLPVISIPLSTPEFDARDIMLASLSLPSRRPVILAGINETGLNKAGHLVCELIGIGSPRFRAEYTKYLQDATPAPDYNVSISGEEENVREPSISITASRNGAGKAHRL